MIIDALVMDNFGLFRGKHEIVLTPPSPKKPVVLIGGMNGRGKTTILDAIQLALYGKRAQCSNRGSLGYKEYLRRSVHRGEGSGAVEIHLSTRIDGGESALMVRRSWTAAASTGDALTVVRDGHRDHRLEENWDEYVEQLLPAGIAPLFFFDGEKIEQLADPATSQENLATAINSLLGLDLIERLSSDLRTIERTKRNDLADVDDSQELDRLEANINELSRNVDEYKQDVRDSLKRVDSAVAKRDSTQDRFRKEGGELVENRLVLERERKDLDKKIGEANEHMVELAAGSAPLLLVEPLLGAVRDQAEREAAAAANDSIQQLLEERDRETANFLASASDVDGTEVSLLEAYLKEDRKKRDESAADETFLDMSDGARQALYSFEGHEAKALRKELKRSINAQAKLREELQLVDDRLEAIPPDRAVAELKAERDDAEAAVHRARGASDVIADKLGASKLELAQAIGNRKTAMEKDISDRFASDSTRRVHDYSRRTRNVLESFGAALVRRNSEKISALVLDSLHQLLGKPKLVGGVHLDPETFEVSLSDGFGAPLPADRLSAGERQLLAVAILWGLARQSGRALPTVIDTPLGRLDSSHRTNLVQSYFPRASHQVLLLSTDEEINTTYHAMIEPRVGRSYLLNYDEETQSSSVQPGYFW
jgi:DNA sulfur modification protein DndD